MNMNLFDQMNRALGGGLDKGVHIEAMGADEIEAITEAKVVPGDGAEGAEEDPLAQLLTQAVQQPEGWYADDERGTPESTGTPPSTPAPTGNSLNAGVEGDEQLTAWLNNRLNS